MDNRRKEKEKRNYGGQGQSADLIYKKKAEICCSVEKGHLCKTHGDWDIKSEWPKQKIESPRSDCESAPIVIYGMFLDKKLAGLPTYRKFPDHCTYLSCY